MRSEWWVLLRVSRVSLQQLSEFFHSHLPSKFISHHNNDIQKFWKNPPLPKRPLMEPLPKGKCWPVAKPSLDLVQPPDFCWDFGGFLWSLFQISSLCFVHFCGFFWLLGWFWWSQSICVLLCFASFLALSAVRWMLRGFLHCSVVFATAS